MIFLSHRNMKMSESNKNQISGLKKGIIIGIIVVLVIIFIGVVTVLLKVQEESEVVGGIKDGTTGNSSGNIANFGYSAEKNGYIYYVSPDEDMENTNIYRAKLDGSEESEVLYKGDYDIRSLNIVGDKVYFVSIAASVDKEDLENVLVDNKIYKMGLDGEDLQLINDNEFSESNFNMYVVKDEIYYVGTDENVYKMDLNGENRQLVQETETGLLTLNQKYLIFNQINQETDEYVTYIQNLDGTNQREITGGQIYTPQIDGDFIYYTNKNQNIAKININGGSEEILYNGNAYDINLYDGNIYYLEDMIVDDEEEDDVSNVCIYKISVNGGETTQIKELSYYTSFINIVKDYVYYMDMDENEAYIKLLNLKDLSEMNLYEWSYNTMDDDADDAEMNEEAIIDENDDYDEVDEEE